MLFRAVAAAAAPCDSSEKCLGEVAAAERETTTVSARFVQTKHLSLLEEPLVSRGRFLFKRPDRVAWRLEEPQAISIVIDNKGIHVPGLSDRDQHAMAMIPAGAIAMQFGAIFSGSVQALQAEFDVTAEGDDTSIHVHMRPRRDEVRRVFRTLDLDFPRPPRFMTRLRLEDAIGDRVDIAFEDVRLNAEIPDAAFAVPESTR